MDASIVYLLAGIFALISFVLDFRAGGTIGQKLVDLFLGLGFLSWYLRRDYVGSALMLAAVVLYCPQLRKKWIRWRRG